jgi:hypothetical protein
MSHDIAALRAAKRFAKQDYDKQVVAQHGAGSTDYGDAGPPVWNRASWEAFRAQYGRYPYSAFELPPTFEGAPEWVYELMGLRRPPVQVRPG